MTHLSAWKALHRFICLSVVFRATCLTLSDATPAPADKPQPPVFPDVYTLRYNVTMPHYLLTQPDGLT